MPTTISLNPSLSKGGVDFIDDAKLEALLQRPRPDAAEVRDIVAKSMDKIALSVEETSRLILADDPALADEIFEAARELKRRVYGNRIVLFAPLYVGSYCVNDCAYCGFRRSNPDSLRRTLTPEELGAQVAALENLGHKRLILVFGEHATYTPEFMANAVRTVYGVKVGHGEIRRVNINAAPLDHDGFRTMVEAGIGTYQIFQETYHHETYRRMHPADTRKGDYLWRLDSLSRAMEAGQDDVGIGALFGLADWRFEVLGMVEHAVHLQGKYGCGPHTISFPRMTAATGVQLGAFNLVGDHDFKRLVAILRLAVPYTGLILTARERAEIRREVLAFGVSQIDAGTKIELGAYTETAEIQNVRREQFTIGDTRSLDQVVGELIHEGYVPSWCTSCYRVGRTGEHFMEFAIPGFIKQYCTPNALTTLQEYLVDYASPATREAGQKLLEEEMARLEDGEIKQQLVERLAAIRTSDARDLYF